MYITSLSSQGEASMPSKWITRERPKIDRIACPWLIRRFIANDAEFIYVPTEQVFAVATGDRRDALRHTGAEPFSHHGELCSFDAFIAEYQAHRSRAATTRGDRARRGHGAPRSRAAGCRTARDLSRPVREFSLMTTRCSSTAWSSTTRSTPGVDRCRANCTTGRLLRARWPEQWSGPAPGLPARLLSR